MFSRQSIATINEVRNILQTLGLRLIGKSDCQALTEDKQRLIEWQNQSYFGTMNFMARDPELISNPKKIVPEAVTIISVALDYGAMSPPRLQAGEGKIARYAWGVDYHLVFREKLKQAALLLEKFGTTKSFSDAVPILERAVAGKTKAGFIGKNTMFIQPPLGSFFFLGEILCGFSIEGTQSPGKNFGCKTCSNCADSCPTNALDKEYVLDAPKCISYLTIEFREIFSEEQIKMVGSWLFGCDICQEVCPFNFTQIKKKTLPSSLLMDGQELRTKLKLDYILGMESDLAFKKAFHNSAILRTKRAGLIRNACAVAINQGYKLDPTLVNARQNDSNELIRNVVAQFKMLS